MNARGCPAVDGVPNDGKIVRTWERGSKALQGLSSFHGECEPSDSKYNSTCWKQKGRAMIRPASQPLILSFGGLSILYSETVMRRGLTCSRLERLKLSTPFSTRAVILSVSISGLSSNTRRKSPSPDSR
jgi:hypothetical protein